MKRVVSTFLFAVGALCVLPTSALAEEGMWMPQQIPQLAPRLRARLIESGRELRKCGRLAGALAAWGRA